MLTEGAQRRMKIIELLSKRTTPVSGTDLAKQFGVKFAPYDFSPHYREGQTEARELGLYMQKYCGCVFSEEDRYLGQKKKKQAQKEAQAAG